MASGWDQAQKKVIRNNGRNTGSTIWDEDAVAVQDVDSQGHDVNDNTLADSISATLHLGGYNQMLADLNAGNFKVIAMADGVNPTDAVTKQQLDAVAGGSFLDLDGTTPMEANLPMGGFKIVGLAVGTLTDDAATFGQLSTVNALAEANAADIVLLEAEDVSLDGRVTTLEGQTDYIADSFKSNGSIAHTLTASSSTIDVTSRTRTLSFNNNTLEVSFSNVPTSPDFELGGDWQTDGQVVIRNGPAITSAPTVDVSNLGDVKVIGSSSDVNDAAMILTYLMQYSGAQLYTTLVWSAE